MNHDKINNDEFIRSVITELGPRATLAGQRYAEALGALCIFEIDHGLPVSADMQRILYEKGITYYPTHTPANLPADVQQVLQAHEEQVKASWMELNVLGTIVKENWEQHTSNFTNIGYGLTVRPNLEVNPRLR